MYLLDTNIASLFDPREFRHHLRLVEWLHRNDAHLYLSSITVFEIEMGRHKLVRNGKHQRADEIGTMRDAIMDTMGDRVLGVTPDVAIAAAALAERTRPYTVEVRDLMIGATADWHGFTLLTRNVRHFEPTGIRFCDPFIALPGDPNT